MTKTKLLMLGLGIFAVSGLVFGITINYAEAHKGQWEGHFSPGDGPHEASDVHDNCIIKPGKIGQATIGQLHFQDKDGDGVHDHIIPKRNDREEPTKCFRND